MRRVRLFLIACLLGLVFALVPVSAPAMSLPGTLAANRSIGALHGPARPVHPAFPIGYLGVSWASGHAPAVRFEDGARWSRWQPAHADQDLPTDGARTYSDLITAGDAEAYQVRGDAGAVKAVAINTTNGPR